MKKRILSVLLLVAMVITMIPFAVSAEEATSETVNEVVDYDYHDRYVKDGLIGLFTAFDADDDTVTLSGGAGTWTNRVNGNLNATFAGKDWVKGQDGGVGYTLIYGTYYADKTKEEGNWAAHNDRNTYYGGNKLVFGLDLLPDDDFTLEYVAHYTPLYSVDSATGELVETYTLDAQTALDDKGKQSPARAPYHINVPVDLIGLMHSMTTYRYSAFTGGNGSLRWRVAPYACWSVEGGWGTANAALYGWAQGFESDNRGVNAVEGYGLVRNELADSSTTVTETVNVTDEAGNIVYEEDGVTPKTEQVTKTVKVVSATYSHVYNAKTVKSRTYSSKEAVGSQYFDQDDDGDFYMSNYLGTDFYAVRIYSRVLTDDEMAHNRLIDLLEFYNVKVDEENIGLLISARKLAKSIGFEQDAVAFAAAKAALEAAVTMPALADYNDMYVKDGLSALYTTFGQYASTANLSTGKWTDLISGATATLGQHGHWRSGEYGGVGFNIYYGNMADEDNDGYKETYTTATTGRNHTTYTLCLDFGIDQLPTGDFTVEYLAMYKPVYVYDVDNTVDHVARDKDGNKLENFSFNQTGTCADPKPVDHFGWFTSYTTGVDSAGAWNNLTDATRPSYRGIIFWLYYSHAWQGTGRNGNSIGTNYNNNTIMDKVGDVFQQNNAVNTYSVSLDETLTVAADGKRTTTGLFSLYRNGSFFSSNASDLNSTARGEGKDGGYFDIDKAWTGEQYFSLSSRRGTDFFTVRIYARALSDLEKQQNRGVDVLQWYGIELSAEDAADAVKMQGIYAAISGFALETDASAKAATKATIEAAIDSVALTGAHRTLYVQKGLTSLFTAFTGDVTAVKGNGYITWMNRVAGSESASFVGSAWSVGANGGIGREVIYGTMTPNEDGTYAFAELNDRNTYGATTDHKLQLGLELLPKDDYTLEYLAYYPPQFSVNAKTGELIATSEVEKLVGASAAGGYTAPGAEKEIDMYPYSVTWVDRIGFLAFITDNPAGHIETQPAGTVRPRAEDSGCTAWAGDAGGTTYGWGDIGFSVDNRNIGRIATYGLARDEETTYDENGVATLQTAVYSQLQDGTVLKTKTFTTADGKIAMGGKNTGSQYFFGDDDTDFYLSHKIGAYYYALRVYDRVLTAAEQAQNNAADVYYYYGLSLSDEMMADDMAFGMMLSLLAGQSFERDASAYAAKKAELQAALDDIDSLVSKTKDLTKMYAAADNLVGLFSIYAPESLNLAGGTWANLAGSGSAAIEDRTRWSMNANGSFGYSAWIGTIADDGTKANNNVGNDTAYMGLDPTNHGRRRLAKLNLGLGILPEGDMTVEFVAMSKPVYVADAEESSADKVVYAKDEAGELLSAYDVFGVDYFNFMDHGTPANGAIDQVGYYGTFSPVADGSYWGGGRGTVHWMLETSWNSDRRWVGSGGTYGENSGLNKSGDPFWTVNTIRTYGVYIDETVTETDTEAVLGLYRNGVLYNNNEDKVSTTADGTYYAGGYAANATKAGFYLSSARPTDFYSVRVYDKVLTADERARNHLVDLILYYDLDLPADILADEDMLSEVAACCTDVSFATDAMAAASVALQIEDIIKTVLTSGKVYSLYVSDGLVANFTALTSADSMANVAEGIWMNRVEGGKSAIMGQKQYWRKNANGSVGYDIFYGSVDANGNYTTDSAYNNYSTAGINLTLGLGLLPKDDFTVEFVAQVNPVYAADMDGNPAGETFLLNGSTPGGQQYGAADSTAVYQMGYFAGFTTHRDGIHGDFTARGAIVWTTGAQAYNWSPSTQISGWNNSTSTDSTDILTPNGEVHTYAVTRDEYDETLEDESINRTAIYSVLRDNTLYANRKIDAAEKAWAVDKSKGVYQPADYAKDDTGYFYLGERISIDYYAVRVYNRVLDADEQAKNHFVDIVLYYGLALDTRTYANEELLARSVAALSSAVIVTDASAKAANRARYQDMLDDAAKAYDTVPGGDYASLYVRNGLVGLYTAFAGDTTLDIIKGVWANQVADGEAAVIKGTNFWYKGISGFGYSMDSATWNKKGKNLGIDLADAYADLDNFTVEAFAMVEGITDAEGNRFLNDWVNAEKGEDGKALYPDTVRQYGWYFAYQSTFRFDMLSSLFFTSLDVNTPAQSMASRWYLMNKAYSNSIPDLDAEDGKYEAILMKDGDGGFRPISPNSYLPIVMQVSKTTAESGDETYGVGYNGNDPFSTTITAQQRQDLDAATDPEANRFTLFNGLPSTVYAIRVYNRALTPEEKEQNAFVDKVAYFNIDITGFETLSDKEKTDLYKRFASVSYDTDPLKIQSIFDFFAKNDDETMAKTLVSFEGYAPILAGAYGYRAIFSLNKEAADVFDIAGYKVTFGALVAAGGTENVTVGAAGVKSIIVSGEGANGTMFYELAGAHGYYYTAAITASDLANADKDAIICGFVSVTDLRGNTKTYYVDAYENETLDGELSILDAADYFVNKFDGNVATQYKYMNSAVLREVLASFGYPTRVSLADDLVLYVDAEGGDNANDGLTKDTAYATVDTAFAAAKAHLGKPGRKTVRIELAAGKYHVTETLALSAEDILADEYAFAMVGQGDDTILTSEVEIAVDPNADYAWDSDKGAFVMQIPADENGEYPHFRAVYADGELLNIAHKGSSEETVSAKDFRIVDAEGNKLETVPDNDWGLSDENAAKATYAIFTLPADLFEYDYEAYVGAELHMAIQWTAHIVRIAKIEDAAEAGYVDVYAPYSLLPELNAGHNFRDNAYWLENAEALLTGDTYYYNVETGRLYFYEENMVVNDGSVALTYASLSQLVSFTGVENVTVSDMAFTGFDSKLLEYNAGVSCGQGLGTTPVRYTDGTQVIHYFIDEAAIYATNADGFTVKNVSVYSGLGSGIVVKGIAKNVIIDSSRFEDLGTKAIHLGTASQTAGYVKNLAITNNYVNNIGTLYLASPAIHATHVANAQIVGNTVTHVPYSAFSIGWLWSTVGSTAEAIVQGAGYGTFNVEIAYNYISDYMMALYDGGAFYLLGGNVVRSENDKTPYNYMHHNYVNLSHETGRSRDNDAKCRFTMGYYHDNSSSNWLDYNNVLINTAKTEKGNENTYFYAYYLQDIVDCEAQNVSLVDNYFIGFSQANHLFARDTVINADFGISSSDYVYENAAALKNNTSIDLGEWGAAEFKTSPANASTSVAAIFAACGSTLAPAQDSGLTWTASAAERVLLSTDGAVVDNFGKTAYALTFTDGETTVTSTAYAGTDIDAPYAFSKPGFAYTYKVNGAEIDLAEFVMPASPVTVTVETELIKYTVTLKDGATTTLIDLPVGETFELPAAYIKTGYTTYLTMDGERISLDTFAMPEYDVEIRVGYEEEKHRVTFTDGTTTQNYTGKYGDNVPTSTVGGFKKTGHAPVYYVNGVKTDFANIKVGLSDIMVEVRYEPKTYDVKFQIKLGVAEATTYATVKVVFGQAITLPEAPEAFEAEGYLFTFAGWLGYTEGMILETEDATFIADWVATEIKPDVPELAAGDINGDGVVDIADIVAVINKASGAELDAELYPGDTDINADGVVDIADIVAVINIASGSAS